MLQAIRVGHPRALGTDVPSQPLDPVDTVGFGQGRNSLNQLGNRALARPCARVPDPNSVEETVKKILMTLLLAGLATCVACTEGCGPDGYYAGITERCPVGQACVPNRCGSSHCDWHCQDRCYGWDCASAPGDESPKIGNTEEYSPPPKNMMAIVATQKLGSLGVHICTPLLDEQVGGDPGDGVRC